MREAFRIALAAGVENAGLAGMLADLIRQNLEQNPRKRSDFDRLRAVVRISVRDAGVSVTLVFGGGSLVVHGGAFGDPGIRILADAEAVLALCTVRLLFGLPHPFHRGNRAILRRILKGEIRIRLMPGSLSQLLRFMRLMSVSS